MLDSSWDIVISCTCIKQIQKHSLSNKHTSGRVSCNECVRSAQYSAIDRRSQVGSGVGTPARSASQLLGQLTRSLKPFRGHARLQAEHYVSCCWSLSGTHAPIAYVAVEALAGKGAED